jgi:hypothetical protein
VFGPPAPRQPGERVYDFWRGGSLSELTDAAIDRIVTTLHSATRGMSMGLGHFMHGQICRVAAHSTPLQRSTGQLTYFFDANWRDPARAETAMAWVNDSCAGMRPLSSGGTYVNYLSDDSETAIQAAYQSNYTRLIGLKRKYDPTNVFHLNRNIRPRHDR